MRLRQWLAKVVRSAHLPRRTVRLRLTLLYGTLFVASGGVVLVVTDILWNRTTNGDYSNSTAGAAARITQSFAKVPPGPPKGLLSASRQAAVGNQVDRQLASVASTQHSSDLHLLVLFSALAIGVMALLAVVLGWVMAGRVLRPLRTITSTARDISATNLHERLRLRGPGDELKELGDTLDDLIERLEGSFRAQSLFVANASHELRTPLTTMRASLDVAMAKAGPVPEPMATLAGRFREEFDHLDHLLEGLLALARAQRGGGDDGVVSLDDLVSTAIEQRLGAMADMDLEIEFEECADLQVVGSQTLLTRLVDNAMDNAVAHNQRGGWIRARTKADGAGVRFVVENSGPVIAELEAAELVQPFRRHGTERTGSDTGTGLGLSIIQAVVEYHGGRLDLQSLPEGGLRVEITLPAAQAVLVGAKP